MPDFTQRQPGRSILPLGSGIARRGSYTEAGALYDMKNARCNGVSLKRREGTINMLPVVNEWAGHYTLGDLGWEEVVVSGSRFLIGVDVEGAVWALCERFPQIKFRVWTRIRSTVAAALSLPAVWGVRPDSRHFSIDTEQFFFIVDERMHALRVDKRGRIEWWYGTKRHVATIGTGHEQNQYTTGADHRAGGILDEPVMGPLDALDPRVYLDCVDATNEKPPMLSLVNNAEGNVYPIKGYARFATVNDCGVIGEWSEKLPIPDYSEHYYSRFRALSVEHDDVAGVSHTSLPEQGFVFDTVAAPEHPLIYAGVNDSNVVEVANSFVGTPQAPLSTYPCAIYKAEDHAGNRRWVACVPDAVSDGTTGKKFCVIKNANAMYAVGVYTDDPSVCYSIGFSPLASFVIKLGNRLYATDLAQLKDPDAYKYYSGFKDSPNNQGAYLVEGPVGKLFYVEESQAGILDDIFGDHLISYPLTNETVGAATNPVGPMVVVGTIAIQCNISFSFDTGNANRIFAAIHNGIDTWSFKPVTSGFSMFSYSLADNVFYLNGTMAEGHAALFLETADDLLGNKRFAINENGETTLLSQKCFHKEDDIVYRKTSDEVKAGGLSLSVGSSPILSPHYRTVRAVGGYAVRETAKTVKACLSKPAYNNGSLFMVDGMNVVASDIELLDLGKAKGIIGTPRVVVPFADGCLAFTSVGVFRVSRDLSVTPIGDGKPSGKAIPCFGSVASITDDGEIIVYSMEYDAKGIPHVNTICLSSNIPDVVFNPEGGFAFCEGHLWVARENEVWGFRFGKTAAESGWKAKDEYEFTVKSLGVLNDRLLVMFNQEPVVQDIWTPIEEPQE